MIIDPIGSESMHQEGWEINCERFQSALPKKKWYNYLHVLQTMLFFLKVPTEEVDYEGEANYKVTTEIYRTDC